MNPNYAVLIILVAIPSVIFVVWKGSLHLAQVAAHGVQMRKHEDDIRRLEAARGAREERLQTQVRAMAAEMDKQRTEQGQQAAEGDKPK